MQQKSNPIPSVPYGSIEDTMFITIELGNQNRKLSETMPIKYQAMTTNTTQHKISK